MGARTFFRLHCRGGAARPRTRESTPAPSTARPARAGSRRVPRLGESTSSVRAAVRSVGLRTATPTVAPPTRRHKPPSMGPSDRADRARELCMLRSRKYAESSSHVSRQGDALRAGGRRRAVTRWGRRRAVTRVASLDERRDRVRCCGRCSASRSPARDYPSHNLNVHGRCPERQLDGVRVLASAVYGRASARSVQDPNAPTSFARFASA